MNENTTKPPHPLSQIVREAVAQAVTTAAASYLKRRGYRVTPPGERFAGCSGE